MQLARCPEMGSVAFAWLRFVKCLNNWVPDAIALFDSLAGVNERLILVCLDERARLDVVSSMVYSLSARQRTGLSGPMPRLLLTL
jgi:hypothetical protein